MTPLDTLAPFQSAASRQLRAASVSAIAVVLLAAVIALALYCLGHAALTGLPLQPAMTVLWSLGHGAGIAGLISGAAVAAHRHPRAAFLLSLAGGLLLSEFIFRMADALLATNGGHGYSSISLYVAAAGALAWTLWPRARATALTVDFGRTRERVPVERIVAARGARNYVELTVTRDPRTGLVRTTLATLEKQFPDRLVRAHRSWLVNPRQLAAIRHARRGALILEMNGGLEVPVSATHAEVLLRDPRFVPDAEDSSQSAGPGTSIG